MADTHEEQLLNDLLGEIAREDACLDATHLEARLMEAVEAGASQRSAVARWPPSGVGETRNGPGEGAKPGIAYAKPWVIAAVLAVAMLAPAGALLTRDVPAPTTAAKVDAMEQTIAETPSAVAPPSYPTRTRSSARPMSSGQAKRTPIPAPSITESPIAQPSVAATPVTHSSLAQSRDDFVPLMPMTEQELTGPFQIVRVQMPRASLGTLRSPLEHPNELVEAEVLLGEDGMARAIRVSTTGSVYSWRSR